MQRNQVYSDFMEDLFPNHVRLSIHSHDSIKKVGINLLGDGDTVTPVKINIVKKKMTSSKKSLIFQWHNVAVQRENGRWQLIRKKEAEEKNYRFVGMKNSLDKNQLPYYCET